MQVKLRRGFFIGGKRYRPGVQEIPDRFAGTLPSDAVVLERAKAEEVVEPTAEPTPEAPPPNGDTPRLKQYAGIQPTFTGPGGHTSLPKEQAINAAFTEFVAESQGNDADAWNALKQDVRKSRIETTASNMLLTM